MTAAEIDDGAVDGLAGTAIEDHAAGILLAADAERVDFDLRNLRSDGRADFQHVRAEHERVRGVEVIGIVLHEGSAAFEPVGHDFHDADERGRLPIALTGESVAVFHQPLHGEAGQLFHAVEIFESGGERGEAAFL